LGGFKDFVRWIAGSGLTVMRDRVAALGGSFEILSSGKGTMVKVVIPLKEPAHQNGLTRSATE
jgi:signal transduction histidine kinase